MLRFLFLQAAAAVGLCIATSALTAPAFANPEQIKDRVALTAPGSVPFHLKAVITERGSSAETQVEIYWINPLKWRRTIQSEDFSQTLIVNQDKIFEDDSDDYFPLGLRSLIAAMVDPGSHFGAVQIQFADDRDFRGKKVPRVLWMSILYSGGLKAQITELNELKTVDEHLFLIPEATPASKQIRIESLPEAEFWKLATERHEIIWPQVLDGATNGEASYYVSIDPEGAAREAYPVRIDNERANESASRQIQSWKFKPAMRDGVAVQAESILTFAMNTRAWGPKEPLSDEAVRKLASNVVEPVIPPGTMPTGSVCTLRIAIDTEGRLIEMIAVDGPAAFCQLGYDAIKKWHFNPVLENGEPRPYRGEIRFVVQ